MEKQGVCWRLGASVMCMHNITSCNYPHFIDMYVCLNFDSHALSIKNWHIPSSRTHSPSTFLRDSNI